MKSILIDTYSYKAAAGAVAAVAVIASCSHRYEPTKVDPHYDGIYSVATSDDYLLVASTRGLIYRMSAETLAFELVPGLPRFTSNLSLIAAGSHLYVFEGLRFFHSADQGDTWTELAYPEGGSAYGVGASRSGTAAISYAEKLWLFQPTAATTFTMAPASSIQHICFMANEMVYAGREALEVRAADTGESLRTLPYRFRVWETGDCGDKFHFIADGHLFSYQAGREVAELLSPKPDFSWVERIHELSDGRLVLVGSKEVRIFRPESGEIEAAYPSRSQLSAVFDDRIFLGSADAFLVKTVGGADQVVKMPAADGRHKAGLRDASAQGAM